jgi:hypothetical protein
LQPAISAARFAAELSVLPYQMTLHRPRECIYLLGYCRPGSKAPNLAYVPPLRLDAAAVDHALKHWRFTPALTDGIPIEATRTITVHFNLTDG